MGGGGGGRGRGISGTGVGFEDEPPLLEELGIDFGHIREKTLAVLNPWRRPSSHLVDDADLAGPLLYCLALGTALLASGRMHFGYIYGWGVISCLALDGLLRLMCPPEAQPSLYKTASTLGYCLLPVTLLAVARIVLPLKGVVGAFPALVAILWCSNTSSYMFVTSLRMDSQRWLVAYPCLLVYGAFTLLALL